MSLQTREQVAALFTLAGFEVLRVWRLPNGYVGEKEPLTDAEVVGDTPGDLGVVDTSAAPTRGVVRHWMADYRWRHARPAWLVKTQFGLVEVTHRKRVVEFDWRETAIRIQGVEHHHAWPGDNLERFGHITPDLVSQSETYVHAWTEEKALEYLKALRRVAAEQEVKA
jgi:hypothetical protein